MEVAAALLDASRKLSTPAPAQKDASTGNVSVTSGSSWASQNEISDKLSPSTHNTSSWFSNPWGGERKRTMSESVTSSEKLNTMAWLGGWPLNGKVQDGGGRNQEQRVRRASCKGIESAMAGSLGKVWYDS